MVGAYGLGFESAQIFQFLIRKGGEDSFPTFSKWSESTYKKYVYLCITHHCGKTLIFSMNVNYPKGQ